LIKAISFIIKKESVNFLEFRSHYESIHAPLAQKLLNPPFYERNYVYETINGNSDIGSISIFKYPDLQALKTVNSILESSRAIALREDELKFMQPEKNYFYLVDEKILKSSKNNERTFIVCSNSFDLSNLEGNILSENYFDESLILECTRADSIREIVETEGLECYLTSTDPNN
jgi:hypothetical protein